MQIHSFGFTEVISEPTKKKKKGIEQVDRVTFWALARSESLGAEKAGFSRFLRSGLRFVGAES